MKENKLQQIIIDEIKKNGPIPFSKYMNLCLYHPQYGYYRQSRPPIGKTGDYYTSPCVHKIFGYIIAKHIIEIFNSMETEEFYIVEGGAGYGYLLRDLGEYFSRNYKKILEKSKLIIVEPNPFYRDIQFKSSSVFFKNIEFINSPHELPQINGIFYSNELFDSMPAEILQTDSDNNLKQIFVDFTNDNFLEIQDEPNEDVHSFLNKWDIKIPKNFRTEISINVEDFYSEIAKKINKGAILTIDYGYPRSELFDISHNRGTLMCYYKHTVLENPYIRLGNQDITFHIDFTLLKQIGEKFDMQTIGFVEQSYFLMGTGIIDEIEKIKNENFNDYQKEIIKIKNLMLPGGMGDIFKFFEQTKGISIIPKGFSYKNRKQIL
ncbi:MAG: SAM-dependent methyltransferase [Proteobacteria bacterium]|nr:SAM-dependent methyltransferase [Pseudomonadota bacterium]